MMLAGDIAVGAGLYVQPTPNGSLAASGGSMPPFLLSWGLMAPGEM